jgi:hypothetical protein
MAGAVLRILLILLPFILYFLWLRYTKKKAEAARDATTSEEVVVEAQNQLVQGLAFLLAIMAAVFIYMALTSGEDPDKEYIPPHMENGKLVPGTFRAPESSEDESLQDSAP